MVKSERPDAAPGAPPASYQEIFDLRPWYHDFSRLGMQTDFQTPVRGLGRVQELMRLAALAGRRVLAGNRVERRDNLALRRLFDPQANSHHVNQRHKEAVIVPFITAALARLAEQGNSAPAGLELFCADGYYSCLIARQDPQAHVIGVDLDSGHIQRARAAARVLGFDRLEFVVADVWDYLRNHPDKSGTPQRGRVFDLALCTGGLYHLEQPRALLELLRPAVSGFLVLQSVVTLETEDPDYFVAPAPGWKHGSRFTHARLLAWLQETGWEVVQEARNELTGNRRAHDRGSSYFLCR